MIKTYKLEQQANITKLNKIRELAKAYRKTAKRVLNIQLYLLFKEGKVNKNHKLNIPSKLSARYLQTLQYQVVSMIDSYTSNRKNDFIEIVNKSTLDKETKIKLFYINKHKKWFLNEIKMKGNFIDIETIKLSRTIIKQTFKNNRFPNVKNIHLQLDTKVALVKKEDKTTFDYWIKLSTLDKGKRISIPLKTNHYFEGIDGKLKNFCQIIVKDKIEVALMKDVSKRNYTPKTDKIALDLGLSNLFATDKGDLFGRRFVDYLYKIDKKITSLQSKLQKQNIKPNQSKKYRNLISKVRNYLKNEVNRVINKIIKLYKPKEIVIEKLDFQSPKLSKRLNRVLSKFGKLIITKKLNALYEEYGIKIIEINPAYTSQTCSNCGYVSKTNRKTQATFICGFCNKKQNSDINAAKNILLRCSQEIGSIYIKKRKVLDELVNLFIERHPRVYSCPVVVSNPYFKNKLDTT